jgi:uncharacterized repeat protein (TIGR03803 family)
MVFPPGSYPKTRQLAALVFLCFGLARLTSAQSFQVIYDFQPRHANVLISDNAGNLYGAEMGGDPANEVFQLSPGTGGAWTYTTLGAAPGTVSSLAMDNVGNIFGTTITGGIVTTICIEGCGTVFELSKSGGSWQETTIAEFTQGPGNQVPPNPNGITIGKNGVLYGAAEAGFGAIYKLVPPLQQGGAWKLVRLYQFQGGADGEYPNGPFAIDNQGNLYGTAQQGGIVNSSCYFHTCGTVFELSPPASVGGPWTKTTLYEFSGPNVDGDAPVGGLSRDALGNLYGVTSYGGPSPYVSGTVFELSASSGMWTETILHGFTGKPDGLEPFGLTATPDGSLYVVTFYGGAYNGGAIFQLVNSGSGWTEKVIHSFSENNLAGGYSPDTGVIYTSGALFGETAYGGTNGGCGNGCGVIYQITK